MSRGTRPISLFLNLLPHLAPIVFHVVEEAKRRGMDEVGVMLPTDAPWRDALPVQGYGLVGTYREYCRSR